MGTVQRNEDYGGWAVARQRELTEETLGKVEKEERFLGIWRRRILLTVQYDSSEEGDDESKPPRLCKAPRKKQTARQQNSLRKSFFPLAHKVMPINRMARSRVRKQRVLIRRRC